MACITRSSVSGNPTIDARKPAADRLGAMNLYPLESVLELFKHDVPFIACQNGRVWVLEERLGLILFHSTHYGSPDRGPRHAMLQVLRLGDGGAAANATAKEEGAEGALDPTQATSRGGDSDDGNGRHGSAVGEVSVGTA